LAASDPDGLIATPVATVIRDVAKRDVAKRDIAARDMAPSDPTSLLATRRGPAGIPGPGRKNGIPADVARIAAEVAERGAVVVYVGLPRHLSGNEGAASAAAREYAGQIARAVDPVKVRLVDERRSTVSAHQLLLATGRSTKKHKTVVDQAAAVIILQAALDYERGVGQRAGAAVGA
jgi:putative Holliday junction resolvase